MPVLKSQRAAILVETAMSLAARAGLTGMNGSIMTDAEDIAHDARPPINAVSRPVVRHLATAGRIVLGLVFFVFGLNGFLDFIPPPAEPIPAGAMAFAGALLQTGYMFPLIKGTEVVA